MKKIIIILLTVLIGGWGIYLLNSMKEKSQVESKQPIFFSADKILPGDVVVKITAAGFVPASITVKKGQRVVFENQSANFAWPASDPHPIHTNYPEFDPKEPFKNGEAWAFAFDKPGNWTYHDHLAPGNRGVVSVQ